MSCLAAKLRKFFINDKYAHIKCVVMGILCIMKKQVRNDLLLKQISEELRKVRLERGISQETVSFDIGTYLTRIESGKLNITISTLADLCESYKISLAEFFDRTEL